MLLLKKTRRGYEIAGKYFGAFAIADGVLIPLTKAKFAAAMRGRAADRAVADMAAHIRP